MVLSVGVQFALAMVGAIVAYSLWPRPEVEKTRANKLGDIQFPRSDEGVPVPLVFGKVKVDGANTLWFGDFSSEIIYDAVDTGPFTTERIFLGYRYYVGFALSICLGPGVKLHKIFLGKKIVREDVNGFSDATVKINEPNLFGGDKERGGFVGEVKFYGGSLNQPIDDYLASKGTNVPAYVGQSYAVFKKVYIGKAANLRTISFEVSRYTDNLGMLSRSKIGEDMNPAEVLYTILVSEWGCLNINRHEFNRISFTECADTLYKEKNGMSLLLENNLSAKDVVNEILRQINGMLYTDITTGLITLKLIRKDYFVQELPVIDEDSVSEIVQISRSTGAETANQVRVAYFPRGNNYKESTATTQDMGNIATQGRLRSITVSFPAVRTPELANELATREMSYLSAPLVRIKLKTTYAAGNLNPGDVFLFSWKEYNFDKIPFRVQKYETGPAVSGGVTIDAVQSVFAANVPVFAKPPLSGYTPIVEKPVAPKFPIAIEAPRLLANVPAAYMRGEHLHVIGFAGAGDEYQQNYTMTSYSDESDSAEYTAYATLNASINQFDDRMDITIPNEVLKRFPDLLQKADRTEQSQGENLLFLAGKNVSEFPTTISGRYSTEPKDVAFVEGNEFFSYTDFVVQGNVVTLKGCNRGLLDTRPKIFPESARIYWVKNRVYASIFTRQEFEIYGYARAGYGLPFTPYFNAKTPRDSVTVRQDNPIYPARRTWLPYPPANLRVKDKPLNALEFKPLETVVVTWNFRSEYIDNIVFDDANNDVDPVSVIYGSTNGKYSAKYYLYKESVNGQNGFVDFVSVAERTDSSGAHSATLMLPNLQKDDAIYIAVRGEREYTKDGIYRNQTLYSFDYAWIKGRVI